MGVSKSCGVCCFALVFCRRLGVEGEEVGCGWMDGYRRWVETHLLR